MLLICPRRLPKPSGVSFFGVALRDFLRLHLFEGRTKQDLDIASAEPQITPDADSA
jgi:hypothetical protein